MPRLMSFPFRLDDTGAIASVDQDSDNEIEEQLAVAVLTRPGERIQVPTFGVMDAAFDRLQIPALARHCLDFGPYVEIEVVDIQLLEGDRERVLIQWRRRDQAREVSN